MNILIIGNCGVGKTWVMKQLIEHHNPKYRGQLGLFKFHYNENIMVVGKYDGSTFEGSDKLSMAVMKDLGTFKDWCDTRSGVVIAEGDRFMNMRYIETMQPLIIQIQGNGDAGRLKRRSKQTQRHLKSINTRVSNISNDFGIVKVYDSNHCLNFINKQIDEYTKAK
tara:strand:+ start:5046 stop:5543 length:498 start_codon:yes stop_codon:yes gene_type:complete